MSIKKKIGCFLAALFMAMIVLGFYWWAFKSKTFLKEDYNFSQGVPTLVCGNTLPALALANEIPHFKNNYYITYGFENYDCNLPRAQIESVADSAFLTWIDTLGKEAILMPFNTAQVIFKFTNETSGSYAYVEQLGDERFRININSIPNYSVGHVPLLVNLFDVIDHEILHALGGQHRAGCGCIAEPFYKNLPPSTSKAKRFQILEEIGYCIIETKLLCRF